MTEEARIRDRRPLIELAVAALVAGCVLTAALLRSDTVAGTPVAQGGGLGACDSRLGQVVAYFDTNADMQRAEERLRGDDRVAALRTETKEQAFERFKELFKDQPELVKLARVEAMPASLRVVPDDLSSTQLADQLRTELVAVSDVNSGAC